MEKTKNKRSWTKTLLSFAKPCRWKMIFSVIFSIISVLCGFVPFYGVYRILAIFIEDTATYNFMPYFFQYRVCANMGKNR